MKSIKILSIFLLIVVVFSAQSLYAAVSHLLISEVFYDVPGPDAGNEWAELYNPFSYNVGLSGWELHDNVGVFSLSGTILPNSFLVISGMTLALSNSGDFIKLVHNGTLIDAAGWEGGSGGEFTSWHIYADTGYSIARKSLALDTDSFHDWQSNSIPTPQSGPVVPEPSSLLLLASHLFSIVILRKKLI